MAEQSKNTLAQVRASLERARATTAAMREKGTEYTKEAVRTLASATVATVAGFADQRYGQVDAETGIRVLKVNGAPASLVVGAMAKIGAAFGIAGDAGFALYAGGDGALSEGMGTVGRQVGERMRRRSEEASTSKPSAQAERKAA